MLKKYVISFTFLTFLISLAFIQYQAYGKLSKEKQKECEAKLEGILLNKTLVAKVTFPASKDGIDLNIDGAWDNKKTTRLLKDKGIGINIGEPATVTTVKLKDKHIEIHFNGGGFGTTFDRLISSEAKRQKMSSGGKAAGGSRINLHFDRDITEEDIDVKFLSDCLNPLVETNVLSQDVARENIPEEFKDAAEKGEIVVGMDKETVFAIKGEPNEQKLDTSVDPPIEKWQYKLEGMKIMVVTFEGGKVTKTQIF